MPPPRAPTIPQFARRLAIETPEHLVLELELAGVGSRIAAAACDAVLLGVLSVGGDMVQISLGLPYATVNIIMALIFFVVLGGRFRKSRSG